MLTSSLQLGSAKLENICFFLGRVLEIILLFYISTRNACMRSLYKNTSNTFSSFSSHFRSFPSSFCVLLPVPLLALPLVSVVPNHRTLLLAGLEHFLHVYMWELVHVNFAQKILTCVCACILSLYSSSARYSSHSASASCCFLIKKRIPPKN